MEFTSTTYISNDDQLQFSLKVNIQKNVIKELIIGNISFTNFSEDLLRRAFKDLISKGNKSRQITFISFAYPSNCKIYDQTIKNSGFKILEKSISFICDDILPEIRAEMYQETFLVYRDDIETW